MTTTPALIATGQHAMLWDYTFPVQEFQSLALTPIAGIVRTKDPVPEEPYWGWDYLCGVYVYGRLADVEKAWTAIVEYMKNKLDSEWDEDDLEDVGAPTNFAFAKFPSMDIAVIAGAGYYQETDPQLVELLATLKHVTAAELGANYSSDANVFETISDHARNTLDADKNPAMQDVENDVVAALLASKQEEPPRILGDKPVCVGYFQFDEDEFAIAMVTKEHWDKHGYMDGNGIDDHLIPSGFYELSESVYETDLGTDGARAALLAAGWEEKMMFPV